MSFWASIWFSRYWLLQNSVNFLFKKGSSTNRNINDIVAYPLFLVMPLRFRSDLNLSSWNARLISVSIQTFWFWICFCKERENVLIEFIAVPFFSIIRCLAMSNILKMEPLFNYFPFNFKKLSLSLPQHLTAKLQTIIWIYEWVVCLSLLETKYEIYLYR